MLTLDCYSCYSYFKNRFLGVLKHFIFFKAEFVQAMCVRVSGAYEEEKRQITLDSRMQCISQHQCEYMNIRWCLHLVCTSHPDFCDNQIVHDHMNSLK